LRAERSDAPAHPGAPRERAGFGQPARRALRHDAAGGLEASARPRAGGPPAPRARGLVSSLPSRGRSPRERGLVPGAVPAVLGAHARRAGAVCGERASGQVGLEGDQEAMSGGIVLVVRRTIRASAERIFDAWTRPEHLLVWWGPRPVTCSGADVDLRVG